MEYTVFQLRIFTVSLGFVGRQCMDPSNCCVMRSLTIILHSTSTLCFGIFEVVCSFWAIYYGHLVGARD